MGGMKWVDTVGLDSEQDVLSQAWRLGMVWVGPSRLCQGSECAFWTRFRRVHVSETLTYLLG